MNAKPSKFQLDCISIDSNVTDFFFFESELVLAAFSQKRIAV